MVEAWPRRGTGVVVQKYLGYPFVLPRASVHIHVGCYRLTQHNHLYLFYLILSRMFYIIVGLEFVRVVRVQKE